MRRPLVVLSVEPLSVPDGVLLGPLAAAGPLWESLPLMSGERL